MRRWFRSALPVALALSALGRAAWAAPPSAADLQASPPVQESQVEADPILEAQVREIASRLRCPVCRSLSIYDSPSQMAQQMRALIGDQLRAGRSSEQVTAYFVERYGEWVLLEPRAAGLNWTVWLLPIVVLAGGLAFVFVTARRWVERGRAREAALMKGLEGEP